MSKKKNIPEIRFKGFDDAWEERKLREVANFSKGQGYSKSDLIGEGTPIILYGRLYTNYQVIINEVNTYVLPRQGSIFSNGREVIVPASGETAEDIARASAVLNTGVLLGGDLNIIYPNNIINSLFLALSISNGNPQRELVKRAQGKSVVHLRNNDLKEVTFNYPNIIEQSRIGSYFQHLDKLINLHQKKYDKLTALKKAMLEKMFPKDGSDVPEIRFKGFTGKWEEKKLGDLITITTGKLDANAMKADGDYDFYTSGIQKYKIDIPAFTGPAITIAGNGATVGYMHLADGMFNAYQRTYVLTNFAINRYFIFVSIGNVLPLKIKQEARTGNIPYIVLDMLTDLSIYIPKEKEQIKIGSYFQKIDNLISLHQKELDKLKNIKKACLEKMFV